MLRLSVLPPVPVSFHSTSNGCHPLRPVNGFTAVVDDPEINEIYAKWSSTLDPVEANKIMKGLNQLWLSKAYVAYAPTPMVTVAYWPWVENYAGEVNESSSMSVGGIFARAWVNSDLKAKIQ